MDGVKITAPIAFLICLGVGVILWPLATSCRPISCTMAVMPSRLSSKLALSRLFTCSTSAAQAVGAMLIRVHSRSVKCIRTDH